MQERGLIISIFDVPHPVISNNFLVYLFMIFLRPQDCPRGEKRLLVGDEQPEYQANPRRCPLPSEGHHAVRLRTGSPLHLFISHLHLVVPLRPLFKIIFFTTETVHDGEGGPPRASQPP